jgi:hypothetical protein
LVFVPLDGRRAAQQPHHRRVVHPLKRGIQMLLGKGNKANPRSHYVLWPVAHRHARNDPSYTGIHVTSVA